MDLYITNSPTIFVSAIALAFALMIVTFYVYDWFVQRRNRKLVFTAAKSSEVVNSMFPEALRDKILSQTQAFAQQAGGGRQEVSRELSALASGDALNVTKSSSPLAELYLNTTIMFADISGFTAWASGTSTL